MIKRLSDWVIRGTAAALVLLLAGPSFAADTTAAFLKIGVGARPIGMGSAFTAIADDVNAVHWNPAGLAQLDKRELGMMDAQMFADTRLDFIGLAAPLKSGTLAFSSLYLSQGAIEARGSNRERLGTFTAADTALAVSFARNVGRGVSLGLTGKYLQSRIADVTAQTFAADIGVLAHTGVRGLTVGAAIQNAGPGMKFLSERSNLPLTGTAGIALRTPMGLTLSADLKRNVYDRRNSFSMGAELPVMKALSLRAGYLSAIAGGASANGARLQDARGIGAGLGVRMQSFTLDYAFTPMGELGNTQRLSFGVKF